MQISFPLPIGRDFVPALRLKTCRQKKGNQSESRKKMEIVNQDRHGSYLSLYPRGYLSYG